MQHQAILRKSGIGVRPSQFNTKHLHADSSSTERYKAPKLNLLERTTLSLDGISTESIRASIKLVKKFWKTASQEAKEDLADAERIQPTACNRCLFCAEALPTKDMCLPMSYVVGFELKEHTLLCGAIGTGAQTVCESYSFGVDKFLGILFTGPTLWTSKDSFELEPFA
nr:hypothetical protein Iba_chr01aCG12540 [Ipomoea batatas]